MPRGRFFTRGSEARAIVDDLWPAEHAPEELEYVVRLAKVRNRAAKYLLDGEFVRPPLLDVPHITSDFSRLSIYAGQKSRLTSRKEHHPLALAGGWRASDGDAAVALANIANETIFVSIELDPKKRKSDQAREPWLGLPAAG